MIYLSKKVVHGLLQDYHATFQGSKANQKSWKFSWQREFDEIQPIEIHAQRDLQSSYLRNKSPLERRLGLIDSKKFQESRFISSEKQLKIMFSGEYDAFALA